MPSLVLVAAGGAARDAPVAVGAPADSDTAQPCFWQAVTAKYTTTPAHMLTTNMTMLPRAARRLLRATLARTFWRLSTHGRAAPATQGRTSTQPSPNIHHPAVHSHMLASGATCRALEASSPLLLEVLSCARRSLRRLSTPSPFAKGFTRSMVSFMLGMRDRVARKLSGEPSVQLPAAAGCRNARKACSAHNDAESVRWDHNTFLTRHSGRWKPQSAGGGRSMLCAEAPTGSEGPHNHYCMSTV